MLFIAAGSGREALWALCLAVGAGCLLTALSRRAHLPTIVLLLLGGFVLGPEGLGLLEPDALGEFLPITVSLAVGLILFEGGLTLNIKDFGHTSTVIRRLLSIGVLVTWLGSAAAVYLVFDVSPSFALLMGSLIIVTGPTVIVPLLRRIRVKQRIGSVLHWEGVLIDSIGVFIAILCFEWVVEGGGDVAVQNFIIRVVSGGLIGVVGGYLIYWCMRHGVVPDDTVNAFVVAGAMLVFGVTELVKPEAGLLSVTIAGLIVGLKKPRQLREVKAFKAEVVDLLIGLLFLLLVARLELAQFRAFFDAGGGWVLLAVILIIRPVSVVLSSWGTPLKWNERALLSWVAPRGVVAASMASLFALSLNERGSTVGDPALLESFTYSVICATVLIQGLSAGWVGRILGVQRPSPNDWVIAGAHHFGRELAGRLADGGDEQEIILIDTNARNVAIAREQGLTALHADAKEATKLAEEEQTLFGAGYLLALTDNYELNQVIMQRWAEEIPSSNVHGWIPVDSSETEDQVTGQAVFGNLARPAVIGSEIMQGESTLETIKWEEGKTLPTGDWHPLFIRRGRTLRPVPADAALKDMVRADDEVLCLRRSEGFLLRALSAGAFARVESESFGDLYAQLAVLATEMVEDLSVEAILDDLGTQEKIFPAFMGHGIAIPHVYSDALDHRICFAVSLVSGLPIPRDEQPVDFLFFLISPAGDSEGHLATLAEIARACHAEQLRNRIREAHSLDAVIEVLSH